jgi:mycofactocin precursor
MADPTTDTVTDTGTDTGTETDEQPLVEADLLVEDVSIDGMCGVY